MSTLEGKSFDSSDIELVLRTYHEQMQIVQARLDNLELQFPELRPCAPAQGAQSSVDSETWYKSVYRALTDIELLLADFFRLYQDGTKRLPGEETMTDILVYELLKNKHIGFHVSPTSKFDEWKEGHDLVVRLFHPRQSDKLLWVCYLQAKKLDNAVAGLAYRHAEAMETKATKGEALEKLKTEHQVTDLARMDEEIMLYYQQLEVEINSNLTGKQRKIHLKQIQTQLGELDKQYLKDVAAISKQVEELDIRGHAQVELLNRRMNLEKKRSQKSSSYYVVTGGHIVYDANGVSYFPIEGVLEAYAHALTLTGKKGKPLGEEGLSKEMTNNLFKQQVGLVGILPTLEELHVDYA